MKFYALIALVLVLANCQGSTKDDRIRGAGIFSKASLDPSCDAFCLDSILFSNGKICYLLNGGFRLESTLESYKIAFLVEDSVEYLYQNMSMSKVELSLEPLEGYYKIRCVKNCDTLEIQTNQKVIVGH